MGNNNDENHPSRDGEAQKTITWTQKREGPRINPNSPQERAYNINPVERQQNSKVVSGKHAGEHKWYDPRTAREGWTPPKAVGRGQRYVPTSPSQSGIKNSQSPKGINANLSQGQDQPKITAFRSAKAGKSEMGIFNDLRRYHPEQNPTTMRELAKNTHQSYQQRQKSEGQLQQKNGSKGKEEPKQGQNLKKGVDQSQQGTSKSSQPSQPPSKSAKPSVSQGDTKKSTQTKQPSQVFFSSQSSNCS
ncbi:hypothetical protein [Okeania sp.]|uniref:hypothetical protein n=1 Tax=Okeania sp. TaxID=3100323 RepID=UPI002B4B2251|nr:hypothetical protein [Okeania sp.]MEB3342646.1 hypothetical protein [Okeania sp.]